MLHIHSILSPSCSRMSQVLPRMIWRTWDILGYPMLQVSQDVLDYLPWDVLMLHVHCVSGPTCPRMSGAITWDILYAAHSLCPSF